MTDDKPISKTRQWVNRITAIMFGAVLFILGIGVLYNFLFPESDDHTSLVDFIGAVSVLMFLWGGGIGIICSELKVKLTHRIVMVGYTIALTGMFIMLIMGIVIICHDKGFGTPTILSFFTLTSLFGVFMYIPEAKRRRKEIQRNGDEKLSEPDVTQGPAIILIWPFLFFAKSPFMALWIFAMVGGVLFCGEMLGSHWGHPYIGAISVMGIIISPFAIKTILDIYKPREDE